MSLLDVNVGTSTLQAKKEVKGANLNNDIKSDVKGSADNDEDDESSEESSDDEQVLSSDFIKTNGFLFVSSL